MKKLLVVALSLAAIAPLNSFATGGTPSGTGSAEDPFVVMDADDLAAISTSVNNGETTYNNGKTIVLGAEINLAGREWEPIGFRTDSPKLARYFVGTFDGRGFAISNMSITNAIYAGNDGVRQCALFGCVAGVTVRNLTMLNASVNGRADSAVVVGRTNGGDNRIENCIVRDSAVSGTRTGALLGQTQTSSSMTFVNCQVHDTSVSGSGEQVGGILGMPQIDCTIIGCALTNVTVSTSDAEYAAGLVCGRVNGPSLTVTDLSIGGDCSSSPLFGYISGTVSSSAPQDIRLDGAATSIGVTNYYDYVVKGHYWRLRQWEGRTKYAVPASERVPGSTLSGPDNGWYTIDTSNILFVSNETELRAIGTGAKEGATYEGKYILVTKDIGLSEDDWIPIGGKQTGYKTYFAGIIDGDGHTVSGLTMTNDVYTYKGFVGVAAGGTIRNLTLSKVNVNMPSATYIGAFVGYTASSSKNGAHLENCRLVDSRVVGHAHVGGLVGYPYYGATIFDCSVDNSTFIGDVVVGAIAGRCLLAGATYSVICSNTCVYAAVDARVAAIGLISGGTATIGGESTHMEITNILQTASSALTVGAGTYSVAIPAENLLDGYENSPDMDESGETWYTVAVSVNGSGTEKDPYLIKNESKLAEIAANPAKYAGTYMKLNANITLTTALAAIGTEAIPFGGFLDGNGFSITCGDNVSDSFFGTVSNLVVNNFSVTLTKPLIGTIVAGGEVSLAGVVATATSIVGDNAGSCSITGDKTSFDVAAICGAGSTGTFSIDDGTYHCDVPAAYIAEYYKSQAAATDGWYDVVPNKGTGTEEDPYVFIDEADLLAFVSDMQTGGKTYANKHIKLANDITLTAAVGSMTSAFTGVFDGNGKTIYNLTISHTDASRGFFYQLNNAEIKNLTLANANVKFEGRNCGTFAWQANNSRFTSCTIENSVLSGQKEFGGFVCSSAQTVFSNCVVRSTSFAITGSWQGGCAFTHVVPENSDCTLIDCVASNLTFTTLSKNGAFIYNGSNSSILLKDCVVTDCRTAAGEKVPLIYQGSSESTIVEGTQSCFDVSGIGSAAKLMDGRFSFDITDFRHPRRTVKAVVIDNVTWYVLKMIPMSISIR